MRAPRNALLPIAALAALILAGAGGAWAQNATYSRAPGVDRAPPSQGNGGYRGGDGGYRGDGGYHGGYRGHGGRGPGIIMAIPRAATGGPYIEDDTVDVTPRHTRQRQRSARRRVPSGAPPAGERRFLPDEVVIEVANSVSTRRIDALQRRFRLSRIERHAFQLTGTTMFRWRIPDRRSVATVVRALERDATVASAQPNYLFTLQQTDGKATSEGDAAQYLGPKGRDSEFGAGLVDAYAAVSAEPAPLAGAARTIVPASAGAR